MMQLVFLIGLGGALGAIFRFAAGHVVAWPWGTLGVNVFGSFAIGLLFVWLTARGFERMSPLVITGFLGGFTTFSAFSLDTLRLVEAGRIGTAGVYVLASVFLSLAACACGMLIARSLI